MNRTNIRIGILIYFLIGTSVFAQATVEVTEIPMVAPARVGMSSERLAEVDRTIQGYVDEGKMVGGIVMIARRGEICFFEDYGMADRENGRAMRKDSILRFYSMTKAITTAAVLMLHDEGKLSPDDLVAKYIPELSELSIVTEEDEKTATKQMTVADLMRHTSGLTYGWSNDRLAKMHNDRDPISRDISLQQMASRLKGMPVRFEPSTGWEYSIATDVLGRVVEVASGKSFKAFLEERFFEPLDMRDTAFHVPPEKMLRFAACYSADGLKLLEKQTSQYEKEPAFKSGGGGLVSTARDYMRFLMMIERGGILHGKRYLKPETVELMRTNQLPKGVGWIRFGDEVRQGVGFGFGFSVREKMSEWDSGGRVGEYGWGGAASTHYWISPKDELIVITLEQIMPYRWLTEFGVKKQIYDSIVE